MKTRRFLLTALLAAGTATLIIALLRRFPRNIPLPYARPSGVDREGEFELFIGS